MISSVIKRVGQMRWRFGNTKDSSWSQKLSSLRITSTPVFFRLQEHGQNGRRRKALETRA